MNAMNHHSVNASTEQGNINNYDKQAAAAILFACFHKLHGKSLHISHFTQQRINAAKSTELNGKVLFFAPDEYTWQSDC